jgi:hypothetical protein
MKQSKIGIEIAKVAKSYIGQTEIPGNAGFNDKVFEEKMKQVGFIRGHSWCVYLCELVWKEVYSFTYSGNYTPLVQNEIAKLDKLFSASATATYRQFDVDKTFPVSKTPSIGAVAIWRYGNGWQGHGGIVVSFTNTKVTTVDGNTNDKGGREGYIVAEKTRGLNEPYKAKGLNLVGFIHPKDLV